MEFSKKGEKSIFKSLFGGDSSPDSSDAEDEEKETEEVEEEGENDIDGIEGELLSSSSSSQANHHNDTFNDTHIHYSMYDANCFVSLLQEKKKGIAHQLWPAATFLCNHIEKDIVEEEKEIQEEEARRGEEGGEGGEAQEAAAAAAALATEAISSFSSSSAARATTSNHHRGIYTKLLRDAGGRVVELGAGKKINIYMCL